MHTAPAYYPVRYEPDAPPSYSPPPASSSSHAAHHPALLSSTLHAFASLTPADVGALLSPHLPFLFSFLPSPSLHSLLTAASRHTAYRSPSLPFLARLVPFLSPHSYVQLLSTSRAYRTPPPRPSLSAPALPRPPRLPG